MGQIAGAFARVSGCLVVVEHRLRRTPLPASKRRCDQLFLPLDARAAGVGDFSPPTSNSLHLAGAGQLVGPQRRRRRPARGAYRGRAPTTPRPTS